MVQDKSKRGDRGFRGYFSARTIHMSYIRNRNDSSYVPPGNIPLNPRFPRLGPADGFQHPPSGALRNAVSPEPLSPDDAALLGLQPAP